MFRARHNISIIRVIATYMYILMFVLENYPACNTNITHTSLPRVQYCTWNGLNVFGIAFIHLYARQHLCVLK